MKPIVEAQHAVVENVEAVVASMLKDAVGAEESDLSDADDSLSEYDDEDEIDEHVVVQQHRLESARSSSPSLQLKPISRDDPNFWETVMAQADALNNVCMVCIFPHQVSLISFLVI
jgi:hypothetical protein